MARGAKHGLGTARDVSVGVDKMDGALKFLGVHLGKAGRRGLIRREFDLLPDGGAPAVDRGAAKRAVAVVNERGSIGGS